MMWVKGPFGFLVTQIRSTYWKCLLLYQTEMTMDIQGSFLQRSTSFDLIKKDETRSFKNIQKFICNFEPCAVDFKIYSSLSYDVLEHDSHTTLQSTLTEINSKYHEFREGIYTFIINAPKAAKFRKFSLVENHHMTQCYQCLSLKISVINTDLTEFWGNSQNDIIMTSQWGNPLLM